LPGCMSLMIIEFPIHDPPALPTSTVFISTATIEKVGSMYENRDK